MSGTLRIYGCGGCGMNLIQSRIDIPQMDPYAKVEMVGIDTSTANFDPQAGVPFYQIPGVSGMGKDRSEMLNIGKDKIDPILREYKPGTMNLVIASLSGGTGSMIAALMLRELLSRDLPVILLVVASTDSGKETENSLNSMRTIQQQVNRLQKPVPFFYYENRPARNDRKGDGPRDYIDEVINVDVQRIALLVSEKHRELDRQDVSNFLAYNRVSSVKPMLVEVYCFDQPVTEEDQAALSGDIVATCSLLKGPSESIPAFNQSYEAYGYYQENISDEYPNLTWVLSTANVDSLFKGLVDRDAEYKATEEKLNTYQGIDVDSDDDFIV